MDTIWDGSRRSLALMVGMTKMNDHAEPTVECKKTKKLFFIEPGTLMLLHFYRLSDLAHAAYNGSIETQKLVASILLELVFDTEIRQQLTTRNIPGNHILYTR